MTLEASPQITPPFLMEDTTEKQNNFPHSILGYYMHTLLNVPSHYCLHQSDLESQDYIFCCLGFIVLVLGFVLLLTFLLCYLKGFPEADFTANVLKSLTNLSLPTLNSPN